MKKQTIVLMLVSILAAAVFPGCEKSAQPAQDGMVNFTSFRDVPGVTEEEIKAIEALKNQFDFFTYGVPASTESFVMEDGKIAGYTALFCDWLTEFFGIRFEPAIFDLNTIIEKLKTDEISFGSLSITEERLKNYYMSDPVATRAIKEMRIKNKTSARSVPRYVFLTGSAVIELLEDAISPDSYDYILADDYETVYRMLSNEEACAFIEVSIAEAAFDSYGDVIAEDFLPLIFLSVTMATQNSNLQPVISVISKALESVAYGYLVELYRQGYQDYRRYKFQLLLSDEEKEYLRNNPVIPFASQASSYPLSFYNVNGEKWEGIVFDLLGEISRLIGVRFQQINDHTVGITGLITLLETGAAFTMPNLVQSDERLELFLWTDTAYMTDRFALLSKRGYPDIELNDIPFANVGFSSGSAFANMFYTWFPNAMYIKEYRSQDDAFMALERGEVDLVMSSQSRLTAMTHYYELSDYKANFLFNASYDQSFAFNKEQAVLRSIIDKALPLINTKRISEHWMSRTYNFEFMLLRQQRPWLIGAIILSFCVIALTGALFVRSRSEGKRLEKLVEVQTSEIRAASEAKSRFLANMSHEIRTPMNSIIGFAELARDYEVPAKVADYLGSISNSAESLLTIINDILDISKIESGKIELEHIPFDLHNVFTHCRAIIMPKAQEKGLSLYCYAEPSVGRKMLGDPLRLRQVLLNLLSNAVKFTNTGTIKLAATITNSTSSSATVHFEVKDSGIGMSSEQLEKVFEPFLQAESGTTRKYGGTGLGLSITKNLIEIMGGTLEAESTPGIGSKFSFGITFETKDMGSVEDQAEDVIIGNIKKPTFEGEVLLCEDNDMNQQVICDHIERVGLKIVVAENGKVGVDKVKDRMQKCEKQFDLIFMDMHMPVMDGLEAVEEIFKLNLQIPIVALTANVMTEDRSMYLSAGMDGCLGKPFTSQELWYCLMKYFNPVAWHSASHSASQKENAVMRNQAEKDARQKLVEKFVKNNSDKIKEIQDAINAADIKLAHRLVHTLKGNAGQLGKILLQKTAEEVENSLKDGENRVTPRQMEALETELNAVIAELHAPDATPSIEIQAASMPLNSNAALELLGELESLLEDDDSKCLNLTAGLRLIPGSEKLIEQIENMDFSQALTTLCELKKNV